MINLTPNWKQIKLNHPDVHIALEYVASAIYQNQEDAILVSQEDELKLNSALAFGSLTKINNKVAFSEPNIKFEYLARYAASLALEAWDDLYRFYEIFKEIYHHSFRLSYNYEICNIVLLILNQEHQKDITSCLTEELQENQEVKGSGIFWIIVTPFCQVLPSLHFEPKLLAEKLEILLRCMAGASDIGQVYSAVEKLAARSENDAEMLYEEFLSWDNFLVVTMTANVLVGLSSLSLKKAHNYALSLFNSEKLIHKQIGIFALGRFHYNVNENYHEFLASTLAKLKTLQTKPNPETDHIIAEAYGNLIDQSEEALVAFLELASRQDDLNLKSQIAKVLYNKAQKNYSKEWYKKAIFYLIKPPLLPPALLKQFIDYCIIYYAKTELTTALEVIEHLAINWDYINHQDDNKLPQVFNHTFLELYNNQREHFIDAFTRWFASNKPQLHIAALYIQEHFDSIPSPELNENTEILPNSINLDVTTFFLSKKVIDNLDDKTFEYLLYRMCGYIRDGQSLAALIISALRRESNSPDIQNKITDLLTNYVLYNYPHHVSRFLKRQLEINDLSELQRNVIQSALESYDANVQKWRSLPHLKELTPSSKRTYLLQLAEWKYIASIAQKARQQSIFYNLMSHKPIKYGRAFSVEQNGEFTDPIKLKAFSYEQELPQGEYIDPVGQTYRRFQWRNIGLSNDEAKLEETVSGENNL